MADIRLMHYSLVYNISTLTAIEYSMFQINNIRVSSEILIYEVTTRV